MTLKDLRDTEGYVSNRFESWFLNLFFLFITIFFSPKFMLG